MKKYPNLIHVQTDQTNVNIVMSIIGVRTWTHLAKLNAMNFKSLIAESENLLESFFSH